jgi:hypothetical protein
VLIEGYVANGLEPKLNTWFIGLEGERAANETKDDESKDYQLVEYRRLISQSTDSQESIRARLDVFEKRFFEAYPDIEPKDPQRGYSHGQRLAIFRRDGGLCQLRLRCDGAKVSWANWHADHKVAHARGCPDCNFAKGASAA